MAQFQNYKYGMRWKIMYMKYYEKYFHVSTKMKKNKKARCMRLGFKEIR